MPQEGYDIFQHLLHAQRWNPLSSFTLYQQISISYFALTQTLCDASERLPRAVQTFNADNPDGIFHLPVGVWEGEKDTDDAQVPSSVSVLGAGVQAEST